MPILQLLMPPACSGCGAYGEAICSGCRSVFRPARRPADRFVAPDPGIVVGDDLEVAAAAFAYEGPMRRCLARLKYGGAARLARPLAAAAAPALAEILFLLGAPVLVPVPVHHARLRERGYNQAALLARDLARQASLPGMDLLVRTRPTTQQHRLNRAGRLRNLREAFSVRPGTHSPPDVVLVDDILTTSATLEACAAVLRRAGAERVVGFAVAREI